MPALAHDRGIAGEKLAVEFLEQKGYSILERNYRIRGGEIDIIAKDGRDVVFVEVKSRSSNRFGYPEEAVSRGKLQKIAKTIRYYLNYKRLQDAYIRFDVIAIEYHNNTATIRHIENSELPGEIC